MNMDKRQEQELESFKSFFNTYFGVCGINVLEKIKEDLEEIKNITDLNEKSEKCSWAVSKHSQDEAMINAHWNNGRLAETITNYGETLGKYEKLIRELREIDAETIKKINASTCKYCKKESLTNPYIQLKGSEYEEVFCSENCSNRYYVPCDKCQKSRYGVDYNHPDKNDNKRFCSKKCYYSYYYPQSNIQYTYKRERERERESKTRVHHL